MQANRECRIDHGAWYSAFIDNKQVGHMKFGRAIPNSLEFFGAPYFTPNAPSVYITDLEVYKNYRGRGIGTGMLRFAESVATENGLVYARLNSLDSPGLNMFYLKNGYELLGNFPYGSNNINFFQKQLKLAQENNQKSKQLTVMRLKMLRRTASLMIW